MIFFSKNLKELLHNSKISLISFMNSQKVIIYLIDKENKKFYDYNGNLSYNIYIILFILLKNIVLIN